MIQLNIYPIFGTPIIEIGGGYLPVYQLVGSYTIIVLSYLIQNVLLCDHSGFGCLCLCEFWHNI